MWFLIAMLWTSAALAEGSSSVTVTVTVTTMIVPVTEDSAASLPDRYSLSQNSPNPFNGETIIGYAVPRTSRVEITVLNILGQKVKTLVSQLHTAGRRSIDWNGTDDSGNDVTSGVYFCRIRAGDFRSVKKMVYMK